jgi:phospholipid-translocating ATPase
MNCLPSENKVSCEFIHTTFPFAKGVLKRNQEQSNPSNRLKTTKYNIFTFIPITLFLQFAKIVNAFFLVNGILQSIPSIRTNSPLATLVPLTFVVILGMVKEAIAEIRRWQEDRAFNKNQTRVL